MDRIKGVLYNLATDAWNGFFPSIAKFFLWVAACIYGAGVRLLSWYGSLTASQLPCKVISVGNITLGGTGKTTLVEFIAGYLRQQGHKVAILSRGYKRVENKSKNLKATETYETMGDEPAMLKMKLRDVPVIVDRDRARAARTAVSEYGVDTVILDDGFQQWRIRKDLEIVAIDAGSAFGNRMTIPRGILREPLAALKRADLFVITKTNLYSHARDTNNILKRINPAAQLFETEHVLTGIYPLANPDMQVNTGTLKGKKVFLVSGIGDPLSFEKIIEHAGMSIGHARVYPDHHLYTKADAEWILRECRARGIDTVITTEKDSVRLAPVMVRQAGDIRILVLKISLRLKDDEQGFHTRLRGIYSA